MILYEGHALQFLVDLIRIRMVKIDWDGKESICITICNLLALGYCTVFPPTLIQIHPVGFKKKCITITVTCNLFQILVYCVPVHLLLLFFAGLDVSSLRW